MVPNDWQEQSDAGNRNGLEALTEDDQRDICRPAILASRAMLLILMHRRRLSSYKNPLPARLNSLLSFTESETGLGYLYPKCDEE